MTKMIPAEVEAAESAAGSLYDAARTLQNIGLIDAALAAYLSASKAYEAIGMAWEAKQAMEAGFSCIGQ